MGNSLLDFVMAVVRDPQVAARYAADPMAALADAQLTGVTPMDVNNLIPMVTDSIAMATPAFGADVGGDVWTSGAATAAFDAFGPHGSAVASRPAMVVEQVIQSAAATTEVSVPAPEPPATAADGGPGPVDPAPEAAPWTDGTDWSQADHLHFRDTHDGGHPGGDAPSFDLF